MTSWKARRIIHNGKCTWVCLAKNKQLETWNDHAINITIEPKKALSCPGGLLKWPTSAIGLVLQNSGGASTIPAVSCMVGARRCLGRPCHSENHAQFSSAQAACVCGCELHPSSPCTRWLHDSIFFASLLSFSFHSICSLRHLIHCSSVYSFVILPGRPFATENAPSSCNPPTLACSRTLHQRPDLT